MKDLVPISDPQEIVPDVLFHSEQLLQFLCITKARKYAQKVFEESLEIVKKTGVERLVKYMQLMLGVAQKVLLEEIEFDQINHRAKFREVAMQVAKENQILL